MDMVLPSSVFISSPTQAFIYRSDAFAEMDLAGIRRPAVRIVISSLTVCLLHKISRDMIILTVTPLAGVLWGIMYDKKPNFWGVVVSHAVLGTMSIAIGLL